MIRHRHCASPVISALVVLTACTGSDSGSFSGWQATVDSLGDTIVVRTLSGSVWGDTATLEEQVRIGVLEGADEYILGTVSGIAVTATGDILILDSQVPALRRYSPDGTYRGDIGREGGGPGEYRRPRSLAILHDGRILVRDPGNGRINVYSSEGESLTSWRLPAGGTFSTSRRLYADTEGNTYTMVILVHDSEPGEWVYGLARYTPDGVHTDTLRVPVWEYEPGRITARDENNSISNGVPFTPNIEWTFSRFGYFIGGVSTDYRFDLFRIGAPVLRIERVTEPVPVLAAERSEQERRAIHNMRQMLPGWQWNGPSIPNTKPLFRELMVDDEGRIWVWVHQTGRPTVSEEDARAEEERTGWPQLRYREPILLDVFEPDGRYLGAVRPPEEFRASPEPVIRGDTVWAVTRGELDVPSVVRYRIVRSASEGDRD